MVAVTKLKQAGMTTILHQKLVVAQCSNTNGGDNDAHGDNVTKTTGDDDHPPPEDNSIVVDKVIPPVVEQPANDEVVNNGNLVVVLAKEVGME
jgi:hypothetical protein